MLLTRGSRDFPPVTRELLQRIKNNSAHPDKTKVVEINGADHFYVEHEDELGEIVLDWLDQMA
jgi:alpha/beta superfamily hydrolase